MQASTMNIRTNHKLRLDAFDHLQELKEKNIPRKEIIDAIHGWYRIPIGTLYDWYSKGNIWGRRGNITCNPELFYVLGALLGDGCVYRWKITNNWNILVGDKRFTTKYATLLNKAISRRVKPYIDRSKNIWFVRSNNYQLCTLFEKIRGDLTYLDKMLKQSGRRSSLLFLGGFFDAEGCVKVIKEKVRLTPKICLDIANTNFEILEVCRKQLKEHLGIEARYSIQKPSGKGRKTCYHLRIYKKEYVKKFFEKIHTTKLTSQKIPYVKNWIKKIKIKTWP